MNKKLLAVALATAFAAPAMAEGVQIYGAFDAGVLVRGGGNADARDTHTAISSGLNGNNFIGFKMSEDLGNGLTLAGDAQFGFNLDSTDTASTNQGSSLRTITSTIALVGDHGVLVAGKTGGARYAWIRKYDPFGGFGAARAQQGGEAYANNVIAWVTPEILPGLKGLAAYTSDLLKQDNPAAKAASGRLYALALMYDQGPISLVANYENLKNNGLVAGDGNFQVITFGGSYDFGVVKVMGFYDQLVNLFNGYGVGASAPVSDKATLKVGYSRQSLEGLGRDHSDCSKVGVGGTYDLSKRTRFYADYGNFTTTGTRGCTVSTNGDDVSGPAGSDAYIAYGKWAFDAGLRHSF
jgi:predicted porin